MSDALLVLPDELRGELKAPLGRIFTDAEPLVAAAGGPLIAVGDVVTAHLAAAGAAPDVAVVDGLTEREAVSESVGEEVARLRETAREVRVENPAATLTRELLVALRDALADSEPTIVVVDGEEDLATLPAIALAPAGASVVYGQPGEGMVHATVTDERKAEMRDLLRRMDGDAAAALGILDGE
ncbi:GTP-dependent dephospho-CoA kinase family protein [Halorussus marinus]|uniref:GTP-dependent dephospho-CoA kinase family protein n=1 Tax=Halorussus marinus TaxID=2505976 RepID=UPI00106ED01E|nr:GTP-dependent dephospho-CoA kinase family protein [Halorussus marinus]